MDFEKKLTNFKKRFDCQIRTYLLLKTEYFSKNDPLSAEILNKVERIILAGGKRIRPFLAYQSYREFAGKDSRDMMRVSISLELLHIFFLIHDDIMDRGDFRHGINTLHKTYAQKNKKSAGKAKAEHFGCSMGIAGGDMFFSLAMELLLKCGFSAECKIRMASYLQQIIIATISGQMNDVAFGNGHMPSEDQVITMYANKTARYTFEGPLCLGAYAAGINDKKLIASISEYAKSIGIAFQLQDDLMGLYSKDKKTGKPGMSDIKEGKRTLLVVRALKNADRFQRHRLLELLGKQNISLKEADDFRDIIVETGSKLHIEKMLVALIANSKKSLEKIKNNEDLKIFLSEMADFFENRQI